MWISLAFHQNDVRLARDLLCWLKQLDDKLSHGALLVCDCSVDWGDASDLLDLSSKVFQRTEIITSPESVAGWPFGANSLFKTAAQYLQARNIGPFLWLEPDAIPLKAGWLDTLQNAYFTAGKPFMGAVMKAVEPNMPKEYLAGVAVYPANAWQRMSPAWREDQAFDIATASVTVPQAASIKEIEHFWGQKELPPTFVEATPDFPVNDFTVPNRNQLTLANIKPETVLWHRNKDGSLLQLLGYKRPDVVNSDVINLDVVLPVCANDAKLMLKNLTWMGVLHESKNATAMLLFDNSVPVASQSAITRAAALVFSRVLHHSYSSRVSGWPRGPNRAFQEGCRVMAGRNGGRGWFWHEADAVAVTPDWLEQLSFEYTRAGKPFMGTIIGEADHLNGVAVYPHNVEQYAPVFNKFSNPWDVELQGYITPCRHRANHLIQHHRGPPSFASALDLKEVQPGVVVFHPDKGGRLMDRLAERVLV